MDDLVKDIIPLLHYLIPGFLSTWIFYSLTAFKRPDTFGQIVQALMPVTWLRVTNCTAGYVSETSRNNLLSPVNGSALSPNSTGS